jgi:hypothetical protein
LILDAFKVFGPYFEEPAVVFNDGAVVFFLEWDWASPTLFFACTGVLRFGFRLVPLQVYRAETRVWS